MNNGVKRYASEAFVLENIANVQVEQVQSDWNQNDESSVDYIKNRPFYEDVDAKIHIVKKQTFNITSTYINIDTCSVEDWQKYSYGEEVVVVFDGRVLKGTFIDSMEDYLTIYVLDEDNNFLCNVNYGFMSVSNNLSMEEEHTIEVYAVGTDKKFLDEKFIPDTIARIEDIPNIPEHTWKSLSDKPFGEEFNKLIYENDNIDWKEEDEANYVCHELPSDFVIIPNRSYILTAFIQEYGKEEVYNNVSGEYGTLRFYVNNDEDNSTAFFISNYDKPCIHSWFTCTSLKLELVEESKLDEQYIPETIARISDIPINISELNNDAEYASETYVNEYVSKKAFYKPLPIHSVEAVSERVIYCYIDIEEMDDTVNYYFDFDYKTIYPNATICAGLLAVFCDDGTKKEMVTIPECPSKNTYRIGKLYDRDDRRIYNLFSGKNHNVLDEINLTNKSTSDAVIVTRTYNACYLESSGNVEYIPTKDYSPATKKYVDDAVSGIPQPDLSSLETKEDASAKLEEAKGYADQIKSDILGGAPKETLDTIAELATAFEENAEIIEVLNEAITNKADKEHTHSYNNLEYKPFYEEEITHMIEPGTVVDGTNIIPYSNGDDTLNYLEGYPAPVLYCNIDGKIYQSERLFREVVGDYYYFNERTFVIRPTGFLPWDSSSSGKTISIYEKKDGKQLDEIFIPDTIARVSNIPTEISAFANDVGYLTELPDHVHSWNDLTDKPFDDYDELSEIINVEITADNYNGVRYKISDKYVPLEEGKEYFVTINDLAYEETCKYYQQYNIGMYVNYLGVSPGYNYEQIDRPYCLYDDGLALYVNLDTEKISLPCTISVSEYVTTTKTLDEKYIPDTIARVSDLPEGFSGSWNDLEDKPFETYENIVLERTIFVADTPMGDNYYCTIDGKLIELGKSYKVVFDDVEYIFKEIGSAMVGQLYMVDYPFCVMSLTTGVTRFYAVDQNEHSLEIFELIHVTISKDYIPQELKIGIVGEGKHSVHLGTTSSPGRAKGESSLSIGVANNAHGLASFAGGQATNATGEQSFTHGYFTTASGKNQFVIGSNNINDIDADGNALNTYSFIVGNGADSSSRSSSNAHTLDWEGNAWFSGDVYVGSTSGTNKDEGSVKLVTETELSNYYLKSETYSQEEVNNLISTIPKFEISVVDTLPTENISDSTVYLLTTGDESQNLYTEYIYVNDVWEKLGTQTLDLSGYATKEDIKNKQFYVTVTGDEENGYTMDKTFDELVAAYNDGKILHCNVTYNDIPLVLILVVDALIPDAMIFSAAVENVSISCTLIADGTITMSSNIILTAGDIIADEAMQNELRLKLGAKLDKTNPVGYGSFAMNKAEDTTVGDCAFIEGYDNEGSGTYSHVEGWNNIAIGTAQHVQGKWNKPDSMYAHIVGNGNSADDRANIHTVDWNGEAWFKGNVYIGDPRKQLATMDEINKTYESLDTLIAKTVVHGEVLDSLSEDINRLSDKADKDHTHSLSELEIDAVTSVVLLSPNGTRFSITVGDDGVLTASEITN